MPEQRFFSIPLPNHPALVELQEGFVKSFKPDIELQTPETLHLTLVYVTDAGEADLSGVAVPDNLPIFGMTGDVLRRYQTEHGNTIVLEVGRSPQLTYLQAAIFYAIKAAGLEVSAYSWPGTWRPHITLGTTQQAVEDWIAVPSPIYLQAEKVSLSVEGYEVVAEWPLRTALAGGAVREMSVWRDSLAVGEFKGSYPVIPMFEGVDVAALTAGDTSPIFVSLPVAEADVISGNQRYYSAAFVKEIEKQMREKRVTGIRGHLADDERGTAFPDPSIYWIGASLVGKTLWGKGYVPVGETRDMVNRLRAVGGKLSTSIYGVGSAAWNTQRGAWDMDANDFVLEQIDLAPADRAGVASLARVPLVTSEMNKEGSMEGADKLTVIRELKPEDVSILPAAVVDAILATSPDKKLVSELQTAVVGLYEDGKGLGEAVKALVAEVGQLRKAAVTAEIAKQVTEKVFAGQADSVVAVKNARAIVIELVSSRNILSVNQISAAVDEVLEKDHIKEMISAGVKSVMGPNVRLNGESHNGSSSMLASRPWEQGKEG